MIFFCEEAGIVDYIQAGAAVVAVIAGFAYVRFQRCQEARAAGLVAARLATHAIDRVTDRIDALISDSSTSGLALRGARATEMIEALRELQLSALPIKKVESVALIRSNLVAINCRIDEVLQKEGKRRSERRSRLASAGLILSVVRLEHETLRQSYLVSRRKIRSVAALSPAMEAFLMESQPPAANS
jgi:hypothetical protein